MNKILTIALVAFLTGCASSKDLVLLEDKINLINSDMIDLSNRVDFLSKKETTDMAAINNKIDVVSKNERTAYASVGEGLEEVGHAIGNINNKLSSLNKKTDRISKKLFANTKSASK
jgi:outer membrane murein-binding lipoprotein Lpp